MTTSAHECLGYLKSLVQEEPKIKADDKALKRVIGIVEMDVQAIEDRWKEEADNGH